MFAHFARAWPEAPVYTALYEESATGDLVAPDARAYVSPLQRLPMVDRYFRYLAPLYPGVFERFDLSAFDTIISSTTAWAKGVRFRPGAIHVSYINTVSRFVFAYEDYVGALSPGVSALAQARRRAARRLGPARRADADGAGRQLA